MQTATTVSNVKMLSYGLIGFLVGFPILALVYTYFIQA